MEPAQATLRERTPPHAYDAECAVLGGILIDPDALEQLEGSLLPEHFYVEANRRIFQAILELGADSTQAVDALTVKDHLQRHELLDRCGGEAYLVDLVNSVPTSARIKYYAEIVRQRAVLREILAACTDIAREVYESPDLTVNDHLDRAEGRILSIATAFNKNQSAFRSMAELMPQIYRDLEARYADKRAITGIPTGYQDLDELTAGLQQGDLIVIAGRPSMGKTAFAMNIVQNAAIRSIADGETQRRHVVCVFSLEMSSQQIAQRMLASEARVNMGKLRTGHLSREDWRKLAGAVGALAEAEIYIDDTPAISVTELRAKCRRLKRESRSQCLDMVVIDYLQLMSGPPDAERREQEISEITRALKGLAKELDIPVVVLSQLNRSLESRADKRPMMSDLRESGAIEQDADLIAFIYRDEVYHKKPENQGVAEIIVAKQRNGPTDTVRLTFLHEYTRFENFAGGGFGE
ncbi:MAG: replicative DNA helicase [Zetaproteobacteria bacterium]|nr:MAG: replicative DNA helicase [Zetaproteobacteria bacterium]